MSASLVGSEMCIRDRLHGAPQLGEDTCWRLAEVSMPALRSPWGNSSLACLLYTSDAADDM
eukprot:463858-Alexandrium_andersonii.AAC.1